MGWQRTKCTADLAEQLQNYLDSCLQHAQNALLRVQIASVQMRVEKFNRHFHVDFLDLFPDLKTIIFNFRKKTLNL